MALDAMAVAFPDALAVFAAETLLPRLQAGNEEFKGWVENLEDGDKRPSLFQTELLDTTAMLGVIAASKPSALAGIADEVFAVVESAWADLSGQGYYEDRVNALREALVTMVEQKTGDSSCNSGMEDTELASGGDQAKETDEEVRPTKRARTRDD